jgi:hypothetical protein
MMAAISRNGQCARRNADVLFRQRGPPGQAQARLACRNRRRPEAADTDAALGAAALRGQRVVRIAEDDRRDGGRRRGDRQAKLRGRGGT